MNKLKVLFICKDNSIRSQMAAGFLNTYFGNRYEAYCSGTEPKGIDPKTVKVLKEIGIDIPAHCVKDLKELGKIKFDCVITLCDHAKSVCSAFPECGKYLHKGFKDLSNFKGTEEEKLKAFRCLREEIFEWLEKEAVF